MQWPTKPVPVCLLPPWAAWGLLVASFLACSPKSAVTAPGNGSWVADANDAGTDQTASQDTAPETAGDSVADADDAVDCMPDPFVEWQVPLPPAGKTGCWHRAFDCSHYEYSKDPNLPHGTDVGIYSPACVTNPGPDGNLSCLELYCGTNSACLCPPNYVCMVGGWDSEVHFCVNYLSRLGTPCTDSCGYTTLKCISAQPAGNFCVWSANGPCPTGMHWGSAMMTSGEKIDCCLPDDFEVSACNSAFAKKYQLSTPCKLANGGKGVRSCTTEGLSPCREP